MGTRFHLLQQMYDEILTGLPLTKDSHSYAALLDPLTASQRLSAETRESHTGKCLSSSDAPSTGGSAASDSLSHERNMEPDTTENMNRPREITLLQLTLMEMMITKVQNPGMEAGIKQKYLGIVRTLVKEASIDTKLIFLLRTPDKLMSHMACKSLVSLVHLQLREEGSLNSSWLTFCSETLSGFPSSGWTAECLWTLTHAVRKILKDESLGKGGELEKLFSPLDGILEGFCHPILSQVSDLPEGILPSDKCMNGLSGFLDLLELLVASRSRTAAPFACQRMLFSNVAYVLGLTTSPAHTFVKKKSMVLLKRCILCKAGEDLVMGKVPPSFPQDPHLDEDRVVFSNTVLHFVDSGWLHRLFDGEKAAHFGGSQVRPELDVCCGLDDVFLRALSLVLLKALETKVQSSASEGEAQVLLESVMCPLLSFLKNDLRSSPCAHPFKHPCTWLSKLFIEQDDDMFEAAKALLSVHLQFKRFCHEAAVPSCLSDDQTWDTSAHRHGCNPHCIFLYLLQSIAFDASVLLDFLISSETCFLEYLVRYLKLLIEDWRHFANISKGLEPTASGDPSFSSKDLFCQEKNSGQSWANAEKSALCDPESCLPLLTSSKNCTVVQQFDNRAVKPDRPSSLRGSDNTSSLGGVQRLVDYESSEDSEIEEACLADRVQAPSSNPACLDVAISTDGQAEILECDASPLDHEDLTVAPPSWPRVSPDDPISAEGLLWKSVKCLQELRKSISRLHRRNLFPYNPAALLKLLTRVDIISRADKSRDTRCLTPHHPTLSPLSQ
ncbi:PREDICTED: protein Lines homolog 1 [Gekko japonicus]|uniref:Protein Lines homolog 1 n=1 Tax=Gekko japonicus TaxID=146911 RepID=A0ABM1JP19_GEKJA|nr:PREDICTED: protein Lines homolog 1 [Gekko japonicus]